MQLNIALIVTSHHKHAADTITITVKLFASCREIIGLNSIEFHLNITTSTTTSATTSIVESSNKIVSSS
jgi:hypothetical protein